MVKQAGELETTTADTAVAESVVGDGEANALSLILQSLQKLEGRLDAVEKREEKPLAQKLSPADRIERLRPKKGEGPVYSTEVIDPRSHGAVFSDGDVVRIKEDTWLYEHASEKGLIKGEELLGVVTKVGAVSRKRGEHKYTVRIPGIGKDGFFEGELELVEKG